MYIVYVNDMLIADLTMNDTLGDLPFILYITPAVANKISEIAPIE